MSSKSYPKYITTHRHKDRVIEGHTKENLALMAYVEDLENRLEQSVRATESAEQFDQYNLTEKEIFNRGYRKALRDAIRNKPQ